MSTFNRNTLALALAAALLPASAFAVTLGTGPLPLNQTPEKVASADIIDDTTVVTLADDAFLAIQATDNIIGRTTGFGIRLRLSNGAEFTPAAALINNAVLNGAMSGGGWTATVAAGDGTGVIVLSVSPNGSAVGVPDGDLLTLPNIVLDNLEALQTSGTQIKLTVEFFDSVSTDPILNDTMTPLLESGSPFKFACDTTTGDVDARIDVGVTDTQASKTLFSSTGEIGLADQDKFNAGDIVIAKDTAFGSFKFFDTDEFTTVLSGSFGAFQGDETATVGVFETTAFLALGAGADCAVAPAIGTASTNAAADKITFEYTGLNVGAAAAPLGSDGPFNVTVCFMAPGDVAMDASTISQATTLTRGGTDFATPSCNLLPLAFNGSVVKVFTFNPAGNTTQESFARITNWGNTGGLVTVEGWDDTGAAAASNVSFNLAAGETLQLNSGNLENGGTTPSGKVLTGALGNGAGKWRLVVTGEFDGLHVTSLNRNNTTGTLTNITDSDNRGEQDVDSK